MTKGEFIDLAVIRSNGGILNDEILYQRSDAAAYLSACVNYVLTAQYRANLQSEGNRDLSGLFYGFFSDVVVLQDAQRENRKYFLLPKAVVALAANQGIRAVMTGCEETLKPVPDGSLPTIKHYCNIFRSVKFYRMEGKKVYLYNVSKILINLSISMIVDASDLDDGDYLPLPAGLEQMALDVMVQFLTGERQLPADIKNDRKPVNT